MLYTEVMADTLNSTGTVYEGTVEELGKEVAAHEIGHSFGLRHTNGKLMKAYTKGKPETRFADDNIKLLRADRDGPRKF